MPISAIHTLSQGLNLFLAVASLHLSRNIIVYYPICPILFPIGAYGPGWRDDSVSPLIFSFFNVSHPFFFKGRPLGPSLFVFVIRQNG